MPSKPEKNDIPSSTYIGTINYDNYDYGPKGKKNPRMTYGMY